MIQQRRRDDDEDDLSIMCGPLPESDRTQEKPNETDDSAPAPVSKRERRMARVARRQLRQQMGKIDEEGYSTDSSLAPSDAISYDDALKSLASKKKDILGDVKVQEFHKPDSVRWSIWRDKYTDSYIGAWGGLGVISVWEFWVRLEIVGWDFIEVNPPIVFLLKTALIHVYRPLKA